ncbi:MAG: 1-deoxy-D-xylulose-5-phosphate synthase N-terminal domain-containing protein [Candidatus Omnitrophica bacterium]|nr:1-deoxy-D-xylulose-5-phosphate synthase N-terminal domain-containing protein [Candidatus Omnitrophota bacterium]MDD5575107.1 1-deoxy-D-xylulose-5-phosphate synthase N-terminal domain-containing protein [Candidatus Omnitrophota bacterium]
MMNPECLKIRKEILKISKATGHGHIPSCFSVVEILYALYDTIRHDPKNPSWDKRDIFILSKGHASLALYCILSEFGYFDISKVYTFGQFESSFGCHPDRFKIPGIEASTGSLGHGIGLAAGAALALKINNDLDRRVYTVIGDGESNEGSVWEAVMVATNLKLDNLTVIYDNNMSHARGLQIPNPKERLRAFGCETSEVNGHDLRALKKEFKKAGRNVRAVVAHTRKGYGCSTMVRNHYEWHRKAPSDQEFTQLLKELDEKTV